MRPTARRWCFCTLAYSVLSDTVEGSCVILGFGGCGVSAEHLKQFHDAPLQQPVNQGLQQRQLRGSEKWKNKKNKKAVTVTAVVFSSLKLHRSVWLRAHLDAVGFKHHLNVLREEKKNRKTNYSTSVPGTSLHEEEISTALTHLHLDGFPHAGVALQQHPDNALKMLWLSQHRQVLRQNTLECYLLSSRPHFSFMALNERHTELYRNCRIPDPEYER